MIAKKAGEGYTGICRYIIRLAYFYEDKENRADHRFLEDR